MPRDLFLESAIGSAEDSYPDLPKGMLRKLVQQESAGNPQAVSPKGAQGLFQFMPATAKELGIDPADPHQAADGAARYLLQNFKEFGDWNKALAAYNAGPGAVRKYGGIPPYPETQNYVAKIGTPTEQRQPVDLFEAANIGQPAPERPKAPPPDTGWKGTALGGFVRGARDIVDGGAQLLTRGLEAGANAAAKNPAVAAVLPGMNWLSASGMPEALKAERQKVEQINQQAEQDYKTNWRPGLEGFDWGRLGGNVAATMPLAIGGATTLPGAMARGAVAGGALSSLNPVENPGEDYWTQKGKQVATGAAIGGVLPPVVAGLSKAVTSAANTLTKPFTSPTVNQEAAQRIADAQRFGIDLTKGQATRDPAQWAFEQNIRGVQGAGEPMMDRLAGQNQKLIEALNTVGAGKGQGSFATGQQAIDALAAKDAAKAGVVNQAYEVARNAAGVDTPLNGARLMDTVTRALDDAYIGDKLPATIRNVINQAGQGSADLTVGKAAQLQRAISGLYGPDKVQNKALEIVKNAIDDEIAQSGTQAGNAFRTARATAASRFQWQDGIPAARAIADGSAAPDNFIQKFVIGGKVGDIKNTMLALPLKERMAVQDQVLDAIKTKALNGATDEAGTFSQAAYNRFINGMGREKITAILGKQKADELFSLGRVAESVIAQPAKATVSSSNSNVPLMNWLRGSTSLPILGPNVTRPAMEMSQRYQVGQALAPNAGMYGPRPGLIPPTTADEWMRRAMSFSPMLGYGASGGLLGQP